jgi:hypothetical protein
MSDAIVEALVLDLLEWISGGEKTYAEVMDARAPDSPSGKMQPTEDWSRANP